MTTSIANLTKNATNNDIYGVFGEALSDGKTRVFSVVPSTTNPDRVTLFMCQEMVSASSATGAQSFFLGWGTNKRLLRSVFSADKALVAKNGIKVGSIVPFDILVEEKTEPAYTGQSAKINPGTGEVITYEGQPVYEHTSLVPAGEGRKVIALKRDAAVEISADFPGANLLG